MLSVASTSGNMALVFESTARFMERDATFKKNLRRSLLMPVITVLAVVGVVPVLRRLYLPLHCRAVR